MDKTLRQRRFQQKRRHIGRQMGIAKQFAPYLKAIKHQQPHRLAKHNALDCGHAECYMCSHKDKRIQELISLENLNELY